MDSGGTPAPKNRPAPTMSGHIDIDYNLPAPSGDAPSPSADSQQTRPAPQKQTRDVIFVELKSIGTTQTCNPLNGNKIDQPCMASNPCDDTKCRDYCLDNSDCWFYSHNNQNGCILYKDCEDKHAVRLTTRTYQAYKQTMLGHQSDPCPATCHPGSEFGNNQSCDDLLNNHPDKYDSCEDLKRHGCDCGGCACKPKQPSQEQGKLEDFTLKYKGSKTICDPTLYKVAQMCSPQSPCSEDQCKNYCKSNSRCNFVQYIPQNKGCVLHSGCDKTRQARFASNTYAKTSSVASRS